MPNIKSSFHHQLADNSDVGFSTSRWLGQKTIFIWLSHNAFMPISSAITVTGTLRTLFGLEAPGAIVKWIVFQAFPGVISGGVAGAIALKLTEIICKGRQIWDCCLCHRRSLHRLNRYARNFDSCC
jgi:hypothetical protein